MMKELRFQYPVKVMAKVLDVSASGYHRWLTRLPSPRALRRERLTAEVKAAHIRTRKSCCSERLQKDLASNGITASIHEIRAIRKKEGIRCIQTKKYTITTDSNHDLPVADNLLDRDFTVSAPNRAYVSDITYIPTGEGTLYLAGHKNLFDRSIVGYAMSERMTKHLVEESLMKAVSLRRPPPGLISHSDRGSQYCAHEYRELLEQYGMISSMSRKGDCYDNAPMESFLGKLKQELVYHRRYATRKEAIREITEYIEVFYNRERIQKGLGYLSPAQYLRKYYEENKAA
jgi:putative transposase